MVIKFAVQLHLGNEKKKQKSIIWRMKTFQSKYVYLKGKLLNDRNEGEPKSLRKVAIANAFVT